MEAMDMPYDEYRIALMEDWYFEHLRLGTASTTPYLCSGRPSLHGSPTQGDGPRDLWVTTMDLNSKRRIHLLHGKDPRYVPGFDLEEGISQKLEHNFAVVAYQNVCGSLFCLMETTVHADSSNKNQDSAAIAVHTLAIEPND
jgi:hypothetical protein